MKKKKQSEKSFKSPLLEFIQENYGSITVMGIFAALAIYIQNVPIEVRFKTIIPIFCFLLFLMLAFELILKALSSFTSERDYLEKWDYYYFVFVILFFMFTFIITVAIYGLAAPELVGFLNNSPPMKFTLFIGGSTFLFFIFYEKVRSIGEIFKSEVLYPVVVTISGVYVFSYIIFVFLNPEYLKILSYETDITSTMMVSWSLFWICTLFVIFGITKPLYKRYKKSKKNK